MPESFMTSEDQKAKKNRNDRIVKYFKAQKGLCAYCWNKMTLRLDKPNTAEIEHIIPKSYRHISGEFNEVAACSTCNKIKAKKPLYEVIYDLRMHHEPE